MELFFVNLYSPRTSLRCTINDLLDYQKTLELAVVDTVALGENIDSDVSKLN